MPTSARNVSARGHHGAAAHHQIEVGHRLTPVRRCPARPPWCRVSKRAGKTMRLTNPTITPDRRAGDHPIPRRADRRRWRARRWPPRCRRPGIVAFRRTPSGAPRGLHCGMGACFDCVVTIDGRIGQRACMTRVADGMQVIGADAGGRRRWPRRRPAPRRPRRRPTCWWWGPGRPACPPPSPRPRRVRRSCCWTNARPPAGSTPSRWPPATRDAAPDAQVRVGDATCAPAPPPRPALRSSRRRSVWGGFAADEIAALVRRRGRHVPPAPAGARRRRARGAGADARLDAAWRDDHRGVADAGARPARHAPAARADRRQRAAQSAAGVSSCWRAGVKPVAVIEAAPCPTAAALRAAWRMARDGARPAAAGHRRCWRAAPRRRAACCASPRGGAGGRGDA